MDPSAQIVEPVCVIFPFEVDHLLNNKGVEYLQVLVLFVL